MVIGLTPRKSLTIGRLFVPESYFHDFLRGAIDGDGNIRRWRHPTNGREQWTVRLVGCSEPFLRWIQGQVRTLWQVEGRIHAEAPRTPARHTKYTLKFGKLAAKVILGECYYVGALALERKQRLALECAKVTVGWKKSKTVRDSARWAAWAYSHVFTANPRERAGDSTDPTAGLAKENVN